MTTLADLYQTYLGRAPEASAQAYWGAMTPEQQLQGITGSAEAQTYRPASPANTMTFDSTYGAQNNSMYYKQLGESLQGMQNSLPNSQYSNMTIQDYDKMLNPETYKARWGDTAGTGSNYNWDVRSGQQGLDNIQKSLDNSLNYIPTNASPMLQQNGLKSVFNPNNTTQNGLSNLQNYLKPYQDQIKQLQDKVNGTTQTQGGYSSGSYVSPNTVGASPIRGNNYNNSRGARYFNQSANTYGSTPGSTSYTPTMGTPSGIPNAQGAANENDPSTWTAL